MYKVGIIGPESTGKTTLARYLASRYDGVFVSEYAREYMEKLNRPYTYDDVCSIARQQIDQLATLTANTYFFDTELIITKVWFEHKYGTCPEWVVDAIHTYPMDVYLLCYPDLPWIADPVRENPNIRYELFQRYEREVQELGIPYYIIRHETNMINENI